jgi:hypothetical protein
MTAPPPLRAEAPRLQIGKELVPAKKLLEAKIPKRLRSLFGI